MYKNKLGIALSLATLLTASVNAHERFMVPSHTLLSGDKAQYVTVTSSISNDIFHPDRPFGDNGKGVTYPSLKTLFSILEETVTLPDGKVSQVDSWQAFQRLSVADIPIEKSGTYRISLAQPETKMTTFKKADGTPSRIFGDNPNIPNGATNIVRRTTQSRVETFVTFNEPNNNAIKANGTGIEIGGETHPNDLFAGEEASFTLYFNGKSVGAGARVKIVKAGTRHRNDRGELKLTTNEQGNFSFTPEQGGFYFLAASYDQKVKQPADIDVKHSSLYLTLEVFPQ